MTKHLLNPSLVMLGLALGIHGAQAQESTAPQSPAASWSTPVTQKASVLVRAEGADLVADGRSVLPFTVKVWDEQGLPLKLGRVRIHTSGGLLVGDAGQIATQGSIERAVVDGVATFSLMAPSTAGPVEIQVDSGQARANGVLHYLPELRQMLATGVIEGVISHRTLKAGSISPSTFGDGLEQDIQRWSRQFGSGLQTAERLAFFVKGQISGQALLTAAYDSDKAVHQKLATTIDPNATYPVLGDNSIVGFDALSGDRLYVRIDQNKSYLLYGDLTTSGTSTPLSVQGRLPTVSADKVLLGRYQRTATGVRAHHEEGQVVADAFLINDSLKQVVEEYPANGTSGPFAVQNNNAVLNSERVEVLVRDRNQHGLIRSVTPLTRFVDYSFEPFSGRILLNTPLASVTPSGDTVSVRISYEVDQGGERFLTYGLSADAAVTQQWHVGSAIVEDHNPLAPYRLLSAQSDWSQGDRWRVVVEVAQSDSTLYSANGQIYATPSGQVGEVSSATTGRAGRVEGQYQGDKGSTKLWWIKAEEGFNNASSGIAAGRQDMGVLSSLSLTPTLKGYAQLTKSDDALSQTGRRGSKVGLSKQLSDTVDIDVSYNNVHDNTGFPIETLISPNAPSTGTGSNGGFFGTGTSTTVIDPLTGTPINTLAPIGQVNTQAHGTPLDAQTVRVGSTWRATERTTVHASGETSVNGERHERVEAGLSHALDDNRRLYARAESQVGLASANSALNSDRSTSFMAGMTHTLSLDTQVFSEYRVVDASSQTQPSTFDQMLANGLRHNHTLGEGLTSSSNAEHLKVFSGAQREAVALGSGLNYAKPGALNASAKLEFRRLSDDKSLSGDQSQDQWLSTLALARKLAPDWTLLAKNYYLLQRNRDDFAGLPIGNSTQERFLSGVAWRPSENNRFNALARYEYKLVKDNSQALGEHYKAHIVALVADYHPNREWWTTGRVAAKHRTDQITNLPDQSFNAYLLAGRATLDVNDKIDLGALFSVLRQTAGVAQQSAQGLEAGYTVMKNTWLSVGYNWTGFYDRDLTGSDYTQQGPFIRLRIKFDETSLTR